MSARPRRFVRRPELSYTVKATGRGFPCQGGPRAAAPAAVGL